MTNRPIFITSDHIINPAFLGPYVRRFATSTPTGRIINNEAAILELFEKECPEGLLLVQGLRPDGSTQALYAYALHPADVEGGEYAVRWLTAAEAALEEAQEEDHDSWFDAVVEDEPLEAYTLDVEDLRYWEEDHAQWVDQVLERGQLDSEPDYGWPDPNLELEIEAQLAHVDDHADHRRRDGAAW